jgi:hypothetical protein
LFTIEIRIYLILLIIDAYFHSFKKRDFMSFETIEADTVKDARAIAAGRGPCIVLAPETLQQIEDAEAAGAFDGGLTGNADGAPFSSEGQSGESSNSASDSPPSPEPLDLGGAVVFSMDGLIERVLELRDIVEAFRGEPVGPIILVPIKELKKMLEGEAGTDGA